jgi:putative ABC transport system substrate-binding protein
MDEMQFQRMKRREFITLLGGAGAAWPLAVGAQQTDRVRRIGVAMVSAKDDQEAQVLIAAFKQELQKLGWMEGRNLQLDVRSVAGDPDRARAYASELVNLNPDVILAQSSLVLVLLALRRETRTIPIVFAQINDPVGSGIVASLAHPGGNITGFTPVEFSIGGKLLELLKEAVPSITQVAVVLPAEAATQQVFATTAGMWRAIEAVAPSLGVRVIEAGVRDAAEIERTIDAFANSSNGGLIVLSSPITNVSRKLIIALAAKHRLPAIYSYRFYVKDGGLISYGADLDEQYRRAAGYADRILKGEKPGDLPVQQPTKYEVIINLKTAKALGIEIPPMLLGHADEVIE